MTLEELKTKLQKKAIIFQTGGDWDKEYDFVFQISSDPKAGLNVVDNGSFYFFYNKAKDDWILQCDFF